MHSRSTTILLAAGLAILQSTPCQATGQVPLHINPFSQPILADEPAAGNGSPIMEGNTASLELRGTMLAGKNSVANIGGNILGIGQTINGYTVVAVEDRKVTLEKGETRKELSVDD